MQLYSTFRKQPKQPMDQTDKMLYLLGWAMLAAALIFYLLVTNVSFFRNMPCLFLKTTGFYCPGCGATRAFFLMLHGRFLSALWFYPAVFYGVLMYLYFMVSNTAELLSRGKTLIGLRYRNLYLYIALGLILANWLLKNLLLIL